MTEDIARVHEGAETAAAEDGCVLRTGYEPWERNRIRKVMGRGA